MTDHATQAREIVMAIDLTTASAVDGSIKLIAAALTRATEEAVLSVQEPLSGRKLNELNIKTMQVEKLRENVTKLQAEVLIARNLAGMATDLVDEYKAKLKAAQPVWSKEKPTVAGFYFWRYTKGATVHMLKVGEALSVQGMTAEADHVDEVGGEWAKIPLPREA